MLILLCDRLHLEELAVGPDLVRRHLGLQLLDTMAEVVQLVLLRRRLLAAPAGLGEEPVDLVLQPAPLLLSPPPPRLLLMHARPRPRVHPLVARTLQLCVERSLRRAHFLGARTQGGARAPERTLEICDLCLQPRLAVAGEHGRLLPLALQCTILCSSGGALLPQLTRMLLVTCILIVMCSCDAGSGIRTCGVALTHSTHCLQARRARLRFERSNLPALRVDLLA